MRKTEEFSILAEVLQGGTLAPFLFIIVLDYALKQAVEGKETERGFTRTPGRSKRTLAGSCTDLDFADDICLLCSQIQ